MKTTPPLMDIVIAGLDYSEKRYSKSFWQDLGIVWAFCGAIMLLFLIVLLPGAIQKGGQDIVAAFNVALFAGAFAGFCGTVHIMYTSRPTTNLGRLANANIGRLEPRPLPIEALHSGSAIGRVIRATSKARDMPIIAEGLCRIDGQAPLFFIGRFGIMDSVYDEYLVITVDLPHRCPQVLIDYDSSGKRLTKFDKQLQNDQKFNLEGNFADTFTLYAATPSIARFATYVLTPDVMEQLMQLSPTADIEIIDNQLIITWKTRQPANTWALTLPELITTLNTVAATLHQRISAYQHHTDTLLSEPLRFSLLTDTAHRARIYLYELPNDIGELATLSRSRTIWMILISFFALVTITLLIEISLGLI